MLQKLESFVHLSLPVQIATVIVGGGGLLALATFLPPGFKWILLVVLLAVALVGVCYAAVVKWLAKRKAAPMEQDILGNTAASPRDVSEPARRARLDDLRRRFEEGVAKFRTAGKDLYSMPWFLVVGEPGSGKTEAIRHCNVGFPPGLQDRFQGAGGTINMNWWFTNYGVILDTAGRLMFEEVQAGRTNEWQEFLTLLKKHRNNCPINGLLLVISAESLIADTADMLEKKGAKFAEHLDIIQRTLDVRFPVFVVVTKCDRIVGFKEFFENMEDPQSQHQMFGWSNPLPLDEQFKPELLDQHLRALLDHLRVRRLGLLLDPVSTESPDARRTDQVDDLYAFPKHMTETILPRLRRYMEMIFVAGEWSARPLFLRGIYFTSSMREGAALDAELAEALGVALESLPEGKVFTKDRAYFLRDLFMDKVFKEKGLVTRATNASAQHRRRKVAVLAAGFLTVALLFVLTGWLALAYRDSIRRDADYWVAAAKYFGVEADAAELRFKSPVVWTDLSTGGDYSFGGTKGLTVGDTTVMASLFHKDLSELAGQPPAVPWIFKFASLTSDARNVGKRRQAAREVFQMGVLRPLLEAVRDRMTQQPKQPSAATEAAKAPEWSDDATGALTQLLRVEVLAARPGQGDWTTGSAPPIDLDLLLRFALAHTAEKPGDLPYAGLLKDGKGEVIESKCTSKDSRKPVIKTHEDALLDALGHDCWNPERKQWEWSFDYLDAGSVRARRSAIDAGLDRYVAVELPKHLKSMKTSEKWALQDIDGLKAAVGGYQESEGVLSRLSVDVSKGEPNIEEFKSFKTKWDAAFREVQAAVSAREAFAAKVGYSADSLAEWYNKEPKQTVGEVEKAVAQFRNDSLLSLETAAGAESSAKAAEGDKASSRGIPADANDRLGKALKEMKEKCESPDTAVALLDSDRQYRRFEMLNKANELLLLSSDSQLQAGKVLSSDSQVPAASGAGFGAEFDKVRQALASAIDRIQTLQKSLAADDKAKDKERANAVADLAIKTANLAARKAFYDVLQRKIEYLSKIKGDVRRSISDKADTPEAKQALEARVPFAKEPISFKSDYYPAAVDDLVAQLGSVADGLGLPRNKGPQAGTPAAKAADISPLEVRRLNDLYLPQRKEFDDYLRDYAQYWAKTAPQDEVVAALPSWADYGRALPEVRTRVAIGLLETVIKEKIKPALAVARKAAEVTDESTGNEIQKLAQLGLAKSESALKNLTDRQFTAQCDDFFKVWGQVKPDVQSARSKLLLLKADEFRKQYYDIWDPLAVGDRETEYDYAVDYYRRLAVAMLRAVASDFQAKSTADVDYVITRYRGRFPLVPAASKTAEFTREELGEFKDCRGKLLETAAPAGPEETFARGARLKDLNDPLAKEVNRAFDDLVSVRLGDKNKAAWVEKARNLLAAIGDEGVTCGVFVPGLDRRVKLAEEDGLKEYQPAERIWTTVSIAQGKREQAQQRIGNDEADLGSVECPGEPMLLRFWQFKNQASPGIDFELKIDSRWPSLWMLHQQRDPAKWEGKLTAKIGSARKSKDNPKNWNVRIDLLDGYGNLWFYWLELRFNHVLPDIKDWPSIGPS